MRRRGAYASGVLLALIMLIALMTVSAFADDGSVIAQVIPSSEGGSHGIVILWKRRLKLLDPATR